MTSKYSSTSVETTLQNAITTSGATSMVVASGTGTSLMGGVTLGASNVDVFTRIGCAQSSSKASHCCD